MPHAPEKSTNQLVVWWRLVDALDELAAVWQQTQAMTGTMDSGQLPANLAVMLVRCGAHGAEATAGVAAILAQQRDSGARFAELAGAARAVSDDWPRRGQPVGAAREAH
ncbi:MAG TPA: hypothetical protein VG247_06340 [Pseudonocardiaceae bacterium]|jgi:hypothetical protein|nr:hypothetical protein [Pseudonocardiaceae bacterium]